MDTIASVLPSGVIIILIARVIQSGVRVTWLLWTIVNINNKYNIRSITRLLKVAHEPLNFNYSDRIVGLLEFAV